jgi:TatA/E family protein of Tat protein translocase
MTTTPFLAFSLGGPEVAIIFVLMLLLFGAKKLPELARGMGKSLGEFKKAKQEFEEEIKYGDLQARDDKSAVAATAATSASAAPVVSEATGKQQYPG